MALNSKGFDTFPLAGKKVFLHLNRPDQLKKILTKLLVDVRPFFDVSVDCVVYNPSPRQSPSASTENLQSTSHLTRGRAMVLAANQGSFSTPRDVVSQAKSLNMQLVTSSEVIEWIRNLPDRVLMTAYNNVKKDELSSDAFDPELDRLLNVRQLTSPAIKVVDRRNPFRPLFAEKTDFMKNLWPSIRALIPCSSQLTDQTSTLISCTTAEQVGDSPTDTASHSQSLSTRKYKPTSNAITNLPQPNLPTASSAELTPEHFTKCESRPAESLAQDPSRPAGSHRQPRSNSRHRKQSEPSGYCEACCVHYKSLYEHLNSSEHIEFASNPENFRGIDDALSSFQGFQQDLLKYLQFSGSQFSVNDGKSAQAAIAVPGQVEVDLASPAFNNPALSPPVTLTNQSPVFDFNAPPPLTPSVPRETPGLPNLFSDEDTSTSDPDAGSVTLNVLQDVLDSAGFERSSPLPLRELPARGWPDSTDQQAPALSLFPAANIPGLSDALQYSQSPRDFSSSTSERIGGRFRACRKCGKTHIPTSLDPDLALKMSQFLPERDIDSFCPRGESNLHRSETEESTNQNLSPGLFSPSRNVQSSLGSNAGKLEKIMEPLSDNEPTHRPLIFDEDAPNEFGQALEAVAYSPTPISPRLTNGSHEYPIVTEYSEAGSHAEVGLNEIRGSNKVELNPSVLSTQGSSSIEENYDTLPMLYEQNPTKIQIERCSDEHFSLEDISVESESNFEIYDITSETSEDMAILTSHSFLKAPLSPEVANLAGPRDHEEEQERQRFRIPRRAFQVARDAISLSMQALLTPTKITSDRAFFRSINACSNVVESPVFTQSLTSSRRRALSLGTKSVSAPDRKVLQRDRPQRRASLAARDSISLSLLAINTPTKITSDRTFRRILDTGKLHQSLNEWSFDAYSNGDSSKLNIHHANKSSQSATDSVSSCISSQMYSVPRLPAVSESSQGRPSMDKSLVSAETVDENALTPRTEQRRRLRDNSFCDRWAQNCYKMQVSENEEIPRLRRKTLLALGDRSDASLVGKSCGETTLKDGKTKGSGRFARRIFGTSLTNHNTIVSPLQMVKVRERRLIMYQSTDSSSSDKEASPNSHTQQRQS